MRRTLAILVSSFGLWAQAPALTPHHLAMKAAAGTWDAVVKMYMEPGKPPAQSTGTEVNTLVAGGFWMKTEFKSEMMGAPFEGHGLFGYDTHKKAHVGSWVDSMGTWMGVSRGPCGKDCAEVTCDMEGYDEKGKKATYREVSTQKDADHRFMTMSIRKKDGKFMKIMEIEYIRRK